MGGVNVLFNISLPKREREIYSQRPKTGRPVFGTFHLCPVPKRPVTGRSSEIRT